MVGRGGEIIFNQIRGIIYSSQKICTNLFARTVRKDYLFSNHWANKKTIIILTGSGTQRHGARRGVYESWFEVYADSQS